MAELLAAGTGARFPLSEVLRQRAYTLLVERAYEALVTYDELTVALGLDPRIDHRARRAVLRAGRRLLRDDRKKLVNVRTVGYRIVKPSEQVDVSLVEQQRGRRWTKRGLDTLTHIALETLTPTELARLMTEQARVALQLGMARRIARVKVLPPKAQLRLPSKDRILELFRRTTPKGSG
jgi:hypothetical protein